MTGIAPNTMTKLRRDEEVSMSVLIKICTALNANIGDIMDLTPDDLKFKETCATNCLIFAVWSNIMKI